LLRFGFGRIGLLLDGELRRADPAAGRAAAAKPGISVYGYRRSNFLTRKKAYERIVAEFVRIRNARKSSEFSRIRLRKSYTALPVGAKNRLRSLVPDEPKFAQQTSVRATNLFATSNRNTTRTAAIAAYFVAIWRHGTRVCVGDALPWRLPRALTPVRGETRIWYS
jgi:hypothetical protein